MVAALVALLLAPGLALGHPASASRPGAAVDPALLKVTTGVVKVVVQGFDGAGGAAGRAVRRLGGQVTRPLPIVGGVAATVPAGAVHRLAAAPGVRAVSLDGTVRVTESPSPNPIKSVYPKVVRADDSWRAGLTGRGVTVALVDTGVADVADLAGRVVPVTDDLSGATTSCENLSGEATCSDSYGHGTFIAGLIAGNGTSSRGAWKGVAPEAKVLSVKIAGRDGSADVSNVLAAIQWVVSFKDRYGIRVLNLSLGTNSTQSYRLDPLNFAVEQAWSAGIAVVVSAGNLGPAAQTISKPADDPWVITVGAVDDRGTTGLADDAVPNFSSHGPTAADGLAKPDVVAPGGHVTSLRAPGSEIDTRFPNYIDGSYRKGSGTSMAAGVVSGTVALMTQADPAVTPDRVKFALMSTARPAASSDPMAVGAGVIDAYGAALAAPAGTANQGLDRSTGLGSLALSRGTTLVRTAGLLGVPLTGPLTAQLLPFDSVLFTTVAWTGSNWQGSNWQGSNWQATTWYGSNWQGSNWQGSNWQSTTWYGSNWQGSAWYGAWE